MAKLVIALRHHNSSLAGGRRESRRRPITRNKEGCERNVTSRGARSFRARNPASFRHNFCAVESRAGFFLVRPILNHFSIAVWRGAATRGERGEQNRKILQLFVIFRLYRCFYFSRIYSPRQISAFLIVKIFQKHYLERLLKSTEARRQRRRGKIQNVANSRSCKTFSKNCV